MNDLEKGDVVYYAKVIPNLGIYEVCELRIRTTKDTYFVGIDERTKNACLFNNDYLDKIVFTNKKEATKIVKESKRQKERRK